MTVDHLSDRRGIQVACKLDPIDHQTITSGEQITGAERDRIVKSYLKELVYNSISLHTWAVNTEEDGATAFYGYSYEYAKNAFGAYLASRQHLRPSRIKFANTVKPPAPLTAFVAEGQHNISGTFELDESTGLIKSSWPIPVLYHAQGHVQNDINEFARDLAMANIPIGHFIHKDWIVPVYAVDKNRTPQVDPLEHAFPMEALPSKMAETLISEWLVNFRGMSRETAMEMAHEFVFTELTT